MIKNLKKKKLQIVITQKNDGDSVVFVNGLNKFIEDSWITTDFPKGKKEIFCTDLGYEIGKRIKGINSSNISLTFDYDEIDIKDSDIVSYICSDEPPNCDILADTIFTIIKFHIDGQHQKEWFLSDKVRLDFIFEDNL